MFPSSIKHPINEVVLYSMITWSYTHETHMKLVWNLSRSLQKLCETHRRQRCFCSSWGSWAVWRVSSHWLGVERLCSRRWGAAVGWDLGGSQDIGVSVASYVWISIYIYIYIYLYTFMYVLPHQKDRNARLTIVLEGFNFSTFELGLLCGIVWDNYDRIMINHTRLRWKTLNMLLFGSFWNDVTWPDTSREPPNRFRPVQLVLQL